MARTCAQGAALRVHVCTQGAVAYMQERTQGAGALRGERLSMRGRSRCGHALQRYFGGGALVVVFAITSSSKAFPFWGTHEHMRGAELRTHLLLKFEPSYI